MKTSIDAPDFPGFEPTGEFRQVNQGDHYFTGSSLEEWRGEFRSRCSYLIYRKLAPPEPEYVVFKRDDNNGYRLDGVSRSKVGSWPGRYLECTADVTVIEDGSQVHTAIQSLLWAYHDSAHKTPGVSRREKDDIVMQRVNELSTLIPIDGFDEVKSEGREDG